MAQLPDCEGLQPVFDDYGHNLQAFLDDGELGSFGRATQTRPRPIAGLIACQHLHSGAADPQIAVSEQLKGEGFPQTRAEMLDLIDSAGEHLCPPDDEDTTGGGGEASPWGERGGAPQVRGRAAEIISRNSAALVRAWSRLLLLNTTATSWARSAISRTGSIHSSISCSE